MNEITQAAHKVTTTFNPSKTAKDIAKKAETIRSLRSAIETTTNMLKKAEE